MKWNCITQTIIFLLVKFVNEIKRSEIKSTSTKVTFCCTMEMSHTFSKSATEQNSSIPSAERTMQPPHPTTRPPTTPLHSVLHLSTTRHNLPPDRTHILSHTNTHTHHTNKPYTHHTHTPHTTQTQTHRHNAQHTQRTQRTHAHTFHTRPQELEPPPTVSFRQHSLNTFACLGRLSPSIQPCFVETLEKITYS